MKNSTVAVSHPDSLFVLNLVIEHATFSILTASKIRNTQLTQTMRRETAASYRVSQRHRLRGGKHD